VNASAAERSQDGVNTVNGGDPKGGSCGGRTTLARAETNEVTAHSSDWHRHSQAGDSARGELADHRRQEGARPRCRPTCWQSALGRASENGRVVAVMICTLSPPVLRDNRFWPGYLAARYRGRAKPEH
jgi:hypothetical protein